MKTNRIDSHQHFWHYDPAKHIWMDDRMKSIKRDFLPADLLPQLQKCGLDGCVAVQANQSEVENDFLLKLANENEFIKGIVGWVDLQADNITDRLSFYKQFTKIKGFRHVIHDEPDIDFMHRAGFMSGILQLKSFNYTYDLLIFPKHLPNTIELLKVFPNQAFVIDHIAKPNIKTGEIDSWMLQMKKIASFENVHCKISGMVTEADWQNWKKEDFTKYLDTIVEAFGTNRIMYGSDWPVCTLAAKYEQQYNIVKDYFSKFSPSEQDLFFGGNATKFYSL
jgi:L-fuconolactonase